MVFKDFVEYFRNFLVKIKGKINSMFYIFNKRDLIELCDKYIVILIFIMDFIVNKINVIDFND